MTTNKDTMTLIHSLIHYFTHQYTAKTKITNMSTAKCYTIVHQIRIITFGFIELKFIKKLCKLFFQTGNKYNNLVNYLTKTVSAKLPQIHHFFI